MISEDSVMRTTPPLQLFSAGYSEIVKIASTRARTCFQSSTYIRRKDMGRVNINTSKCIEQIEL